MITRIDRISSFGIFRDFRWNDSLPGFSKLNLLYGWNYSGKTTLSRIFQAMEEQTLPREFASGHFRVALDDGSMIDSQDLSSSPRIRVFNQDFVHRNFEVEHTAPAVFILGEERLALRDRLRCLIDRRERVALLLRAAQVKRQQLATELDRLGTDKARDIGQLLGVRDFRRPDLDRRIAEIREEAETHLLSADAVDARLQTVRNIEQHTALTPVDVALPDLSGIAQEVINLLGQTPSNRAIARLREDHNLEAWVRDGLRLHSNDTTCEFCGNALTEARLSELRGHFSEEYERFTQELQTTSGVLTTPLPTALHLDEVRFVADQRGRFVAAKTGFAKWLQWVDTIRAELLEALVQKQAAVETPMSWGGDLARSAEGTQLLAAVNLAIDRHNVAVNEAGKTKTLAREALEKHYAAHFLQEGGVVEKRAELDRWTREGARAHGLQAKLDSQIRSIESTIQQSSVGAARLSSLTRYLLADCDLDVVSVGDASFQFMREGQPASHMSEGEKTALTFAYFVTSLEASGASISDTIIVVDDPVSSLDSNHVYAVFALIVERLAQAHQLVVSTHSTELFNLLKSQWLVGGRDRNDTRAYHVWRMGDPGGRMCAELRDLPHLLRAYKSEYEFLFSQLHAFAQATTPTLHEAYTAPTLLRKFLEAYLGFRQAVPRRWAEKLCLLLDTAESRREIQKFANEESHLQALGRALDHSNLVPGSQRCVKMVLDGLREKDPVHYEALISAVSQSTR